MEAYVHLILVCIIICTFDTLNGRFLVPIFLLAMLGQPRKYGCHQKKLHPRSLGDSTALWNPQDIVQFLELLFSLLELLSSSSNYCPEVPRAIDQSCPIQFLELMSSSSSYCPVPRATVQFLQLLISPLELLISLLELFISLLKLLSSFLEPFFSNFPQIG